jgi:DNA polymerase
VPPGEFNEIRAQEMLPTLDLETFSEAGFAWVPPRPPPPTYKAHLRPAPCELGQWASLPGFDKNKRGLPAVGVHAYVEHPTFKILLLAYDLTPQYGGATEIQWEYGEPLTALTALFDHVRRGRLIESHNAEFERTCWNKWAVPALGWPALSIVQQRCSAVKARAAGYPGALDPLTQVLDTRVKKDPDGARLMKLFSIPRQPTKKDRRTVTQPHEAPDEWAKYKLYNRIDIRSEAEASSRVPDLPPDEQRLWFLDQEINDRGMAVDLPGIDNCLAIVEQAYDRFGAEFRELTGGIEPTELAQLQAWLDERGVYMPNMQAETIDDTVERLPDGPAQRALQIRQILGSASVKKLYALKAQVCRDGRVRGMYQMHSTHHGRTGGYGPQPANLYKGAWHEPAEIDAALRVIASRSLAAVEAAYPDISPLEVVNNCLRSLFIAGPGMKLVSSDYSAIEDVVLAALAGEEWVLEVHRTHGMIYEAQISKMTGVPLEEFIRHKRETGKHHPLRQQGKLAKLSGGYASWVEGWKKFGADKYYKSDDEIKQAILSFRRSVPNIVEFWGGQTRNKFDRAPDGGYAPCRAELYGLEGAAIAATQNPGTRYDVGIVSLYVENDTLFMRLPSGRLIRYHKPRLTRATRPYAEEWELALSYEGWNTNTAKGPPAWIRMDLYGGVLTQNATGGTARDIMQHGMLNVAADGYPIVMQTYDEPVSEVPLDYGDVVEFEAGLNDLPDYARSWPVKAKGGWQGPRYGKWD